MNVKDLRKRLHYRRLLLVLMFLLVVVFSSCIPFFWLFRSGRAFHTNHHYLLYNGSHKAPLPAANLLPAPGATLLPEPATNGTLHSKWERGPYHIWELFVEDFEEMKRQLKIFVYFDAFNNSDPYANIFLPLENPYLHPKLGNYFSEHMFKVALLRSSLVTPVPEKAHFFFLPFSINSLRNDPRFHTEESISEFVTHYTNTISRRFSYWNASAGADHFYVYCHSVGRQAASKHPALHNNAIQLTCCSSYFQRFFVPHKDVGLPQVWPRPPLPVLDPPHTRHRLVYFAGRVQNSQVRQEIIKLWGNDTEMDIFNGSSSLPYEEGFKRSRYCLHVKGYEVNTARISDAIHYGCIPVIVSNYYDLPFASVLDWSTFSVVLSHADIPFLKTTLLAISREAYMAMYQNLCKIRRHFEWHATPKGYDSFYMTAYQLWQRRNIHRLS